MVFLMSMEKVFDALYDIKDTSLDLFGVDRETITTKYDIGLLKLTNDTFETLLNKTKVILNTTLKDIDPSVGPIERPQDIITLFENPAFIESLDKLYDSLDSPSTSHSLGSASYKVPDWLKNKLNPEDMDVLFANGVIRPQGFFSEKIDNHERFRQRMTSKPNAIVSLDKSPCEHPYLPELQNFVPDLDKLFSIEERSVPELIPAIFIDTEELLEELVKHLEEEKELAIDLENHSYRSYQGFCCLIQMSTRSRDFIIDALALRSSLTILNRVTTNPNIIKVLHGSEQDVLWLQRDFSVYLVNTFDTFFASQTLNFPRHSLAYVLSHYFGVELNKSYQLADWRQRPLPKGMLKYAQSDTHYLLGAYDKLRQDILNLEDPRRAMLSVVSKSNELCQHGYINETYSESSYESLFFKSGNYSTQQTRVFKVLHEWRDQLARIEDESTAFILPNHMLTRIASLDLPFTEAKLYSACGNVPFALKQFGRDIVNLMTKASQDSDMEHTPADEKEVVDLTGPSIDVASEEESPEIYLLLSDDDDIPLAPSSMVSMVNEVSSDVNIPVAVLPQMELPYTPSNNEIEMVDAPEEIFEEYEDFDKYIQPGQLHLVQSKKAKIDTSTENSNFQPFDYSIDPANEKKSTGSKTNFFRPYSSIEVPAFKKPFNRKRPNNHGSKSMTFRK